MYIIQQKATKLIPSLHNKPYENRLVNLGFNLLETKFRAQLIEVCKIINGSDNAELNNFFSS